MQNPTWKHHYIPIFYSKRWADPATGLVYRYRKFGTKVDERRVAPAACGWARNLYALPEETGDAEQWLEQVYLKRLDDAAARVLDRMLGFGATRPNLGAEDVATWVMFVLSLLNRTPRALQAMKSYGVSVTSEILTEAADRYSELRGRTDPETLDEFLATRLHVTSDRTILLNFPRLLTSERILEVTGKAPWGIFTVPRSQPSLLLSDAPVARTNGFHTENGHIALPLSPRRLMIIVRDSATARLMQGAPIGNLVRAMNRETVTRAREFVVADSPGQARFIRRYFGAAADDTHLFRVE